MKRKLTLASVSLAALVYACGGQVAEVLPPTGQIVLYVSTDAPLPPPDGASPNPNDVPALFDRLRIELYAPNEKTPCRDCTREFPLDRDLVKNGQASFGFVPPVGKSGYLAKLQLYRAIAVRQGVPIPSAAITRIVALPKVSADGIVNAGVTLRVDEVGQPKGAFDAPAIVEEGKPDFNLVGSWPGAVRVKCTTAPKPGEVCVPGGAYWMGDPTRGAQTPQFEVGTPRLVVLSPFFIESTEVTVAAFRTANIARIDPTTKMSEDPYEAENRGRPSQFYIDIFGPCTFTQTPGVKHAIARTKYDFCGVAGDPVPIPGQDKAPDTKEITPEEYDGSLTNRNTDALPVTCMSWAKATQYCRMFGKDLPSEAQIEFLAGGFASHRFPWGNEEPGCDDAVFERAQTPDAKCRAPDALGQPLPPGSGKLDRIKLEGGEVVDIAGNVAELVRDAWNRPDESCWTPSLLKDPVCNKPSVEDAEAETCAAHTEPFWGATPVQPHAPYSLKGGSWASASFNLWAAHHELQFPYRRGSAFGFRCAREDK